MNEEYKIIKGDCLKIIDRLIEKNIKVDMVLTDPPYGTTACKWDNIIDFNLMWKKLNKICNENTPILLFGSEPFSSYLRMSNIKNYKYDWKWDKVLGSNFIQAKKMPLKVYEDICVFYKKQPIYNPIMTERPQENVRYKEEKETYKTNNINKVKQIAKSTFRDIPKYPINKIEINKNNKELNSKYRVHPTQKPIDLLEYLIKTYTNENDIVLDFTMGSGSTGVACINTNRRFIGIELDEKYFDIAKNRIEESIYKTKSDFKM